MIFNNLVKLAKLGTKKLKDLKLFSRELLRLILTTHKSTSNIGKST